MDSRDVLATQIKDDIQKLREELDKIDKEERIFGELLNFLMANKVPNIPIESIYRIKDLLRKYVDKNTLTPSLADFKDWFLQNQSLDMSIYEQYYQVDNPNATSCVGKKSVKLSNVLKGGFNKKK